jgi:PAS domain S-box-containing protein
MKDIVKTEKDISEIYRNMDYLEKMVSTIAMAESGRRGYFITGDEEYLAYYKSASSTIDTLYSKLKKDIEDNPNQQYNLDTLRILISERFDLMKRSINTQQTKGTNLKNFEPLSEESRTKSEKIRSIISRMKSEEETSINLKQGETNKSSKFTLYIMGGGGVISFLILLVIFNMSMAMSSGTYKDPRSPNMTQGELESVVRNRTAELSKMNRKLNQKITELEASDSALKKSEKDYRTLFEQAHDAIIIFDPEDETVLDVNVRACEVYGLNKDEFLNMSMKKVSKNAIEGTEHLKRTLEKGYYHNFQSVQYKKDGTEMLMEINASVIYYQGKAAILSINRDITGRIMQIK